VNDAIDFSCRRSCARQEHRYALGAFNVLDSHFLRALFAAAKQERSPFIINIAEVHFKYVSLDSLVEAVKFEAARHDIPVVLNLDHGLHLTPWCAPCA
jgi:fructose-bisphosphate aldolase class II